jgi:hypothetical protein
MFMSKEAEALNRALMIRRLSMLTYWGSYEGLRMHLPVLHERLVELSKSYTGYTLGEVSRLGVGAGLIGLGLVTYV